MTPSVISGALDGVAWMQACGASPRGMVLSPPLIGGHALMQFRMLRPLVRRRYDLLSFTYSGHGESRGAFSIGAALDNTLAMLDLALEKSGRSGLPLHGFASCFAALPMLHALRLRGEPLSRVVLINAVPHLRYEKILGDFLAQWKGEGLGRPNWPGLGSALQAYLETLFPDVIHKREAFGTLSRRRIRWWKMVRELFTLRKINVDPLENTRVLCVYGRRDRLLRQMGFTDWSLYEALIARTCPHVRFRPMEADHFFSTPAMRRKLIAEVDGFLSAGP